MPSPNGPREVARKGWTPGYGNVGVLGVRKCALSVMGEAAQVQGDVNKGPANVVGKRNIRTENVVDTPRRRGWGDGGPGRRRDLQPKVVQVRKTSSEGRKV